MAFSKDNTKKYRAVSRLTYILAIVLTAGLFQSYLSTGLLLLAILAGAFYCGWLCPFGFVQDTASDIGKLFTKKKYRLPPKIQRYLQFLRYIIYALTFSSLGYLVIYDPQFSFVSLLSNQSLSIAIWSVMIFFFLASLFIDRPFCNYLCAEGGRISLLGILRPLRIKRDPKTCIGCGICDKNCAMNIEISTKNQINNIACINCMECQRVCPNNSLSYGLTKIPKKD